MNIIMRNDKTLDLLFTKVPSPVIVNRVKGITLVGKDQSDLFLSLYLYFECSVVFLHMVGSILATYPKTLLIRS